MRFLILVVVSVISLAASAAQPFHVAIDVSDVEESAAFYSRLFGLEMLRSADLPAKGARMRVLGDGSTMIELIELDSSKKVPLAEDGSAERLHGLSKIGFLVEDLDSSLELALELGAEIHGRVVVDTELSLRTVVLHDPGGVSLQLFEHISDGEGRDGVK